MVIIIVFIAVAAIAALIYLVAKQPSRKLVGQAMQRLDPERQDEYLELVNDSLELGISFDTCLKCHDYFKTHIELMQTYGNTSKQANDLMLKAIDELTPNLWMAYGRLQNSKWSDKYNSRFYLMSDEERMKEANVIGISPERHKRYEHFYDNICKAVNKYGDQSKEFQEVFANTLKIVDDRAAFRRFFERQDEIDNN